MNLGIIFLIGALIILGIYLMEYWIEEEGW